MSNCVAQYVHNWWSECVDKRVCSGKVFNFSPNCTYLMTSWSVTLSIRPQGTLSHTNERSGTKYAMLGRSSTYVCECVVRIVTQSDWRWYVCVLSLQSLNSLITADLHYILVVGCMPTQCIHNWWKWVCLTKGYIIERSSICLQTVLTWQSVGHNIYYHTL